MRSIGSALGAAMLLEGSVRRQSERVRVTAQLTEVATGVHLWSGILEREVRDGWAVQQEIAKAVMEGVHIALTSGEESTDRQAAHRQRPRLRAVPSRVSCSRPLSMYGRKRRRWHSLNVHHWRIQATRFLFWV